MKNIIKTILNVTAIAIVSVWFIATIWACGYQSAKNEQKAVQAKETASMTDSTLMRMEGKIDTLIVNSVAKTEK